MKNYIEIERFKVEIERRDLTIACLIMMASVDYKALMPWRNLAEQVAKDKVNTTLHELLDQWAAAQ